MLSMSKERRYLVCLTLFLLACSGCHLIFPFGTTPPPNGGDAAAGLDAVLPEEMSNGEGHAPDGPGDAAGLDKRVPDAQPGPLFVDHFNSPGGLTGDTGTWTVSGGVYKQMACLQASDTKVTGQSWTDVTVKVKIRALNVCGTPGLGQAGPLLRVVSHGGCNNRYYWCVVDFDANKLYAGPFYNQCITGAGNSQTTPGLKMNTWYQLAFSAKGKTVTCKLSGDNLSSTITVSYTDNSSSWIPSGSAGLFTAGLQADFDDFVVVKN
jgi:hypothetical protein